MRYIHCLLLALALTGCTWETYQTEDGRTSLRQKYPKGTPVYYESGTYSPNMRNNEFRPEQHAIQQSSGTDQEARGTHWEKPARYNQ
ncbi:spore cortex protein [Neisseria canis]|uniref:Lipoprotein n=1 Tax=Neisseria canis TaxID=493 RepID=A0A448D6K0_9NEIS|nr:spore cortex protein [Neisseria canis]OSI12780.1 spore cortex protein [Neisseria canis]VEF00025.1 lipoprotein [Neisseria canis]